MSKYCYSSINGSVYGAVAAKRAKHMVLMSPAEEAVYEKWLKDWEKDNTLPKPDFPLTGEVVLDSVPAPKKKRSTRKAKKPDIVDAEIVEPPPAENPNADLEAILDGADNS